MPYVRQQRASYLALCDARVSVLPLWLGIAAGCSGDGLQGKLTVVRKDTRPEVIIQQPPDEQKAETVEHAAEPVPVPKARTDAVPLVHPDVQSFEPLGDPVGKGPTFQALLRFSEPVTSRL